MEGSSETWVFEFEKLIKSRGRGTSEGISGKSSGLEEGNKGRYRVDGRIIDVGIRRLSISEFFEFFMQRLRRKIEDSETSIGNDRELENENE